MVKSLAVLCDKTNASPLAIVQDEQRNRLSIQNEAN